MRIGTVLGILLKALSTHRRNVAEVNLKLCFPNDTEQQIQSKLTKHFKALGMAFMELGICWWWSDKRLANLCTIEGLENIPKETSKGNGILLLSCHFTTLEMGGRLLGLHQKINAVYRKHSTPFFENFVKNKRTKYVESTIEKHDIKSLLRCLKDNKVLWYAPDQNFSHKNSILANFFGNPAPTNPATARLCKITNASVVPFVQYRRQDGKGYALRILPALTNFPSGDDLQDANRINQIFEKRLPGNTVDVYKKSKD